MKFHYSDRYESHPNYNQLKSLDLFLEKLSLEHLEEFSKDLYTSLKFMAFGLGDKKVIYVPSPQVPARIEEQIRQKIRLLFPE